MTADVVIARLSRLLLVIFMLGLAGIAAELHLVGHVRGTMQVVPLAWPRSA